MDAPTPRPDPTFEKEGPRSPHEPWWSKQGYLPLIAFWGGLLGLSLFILAKPEKEQPIFQQDASVGYQFTFVDMDLKDHSKDGLVYISANKATYDRQEGSVFLENPEIRSTDKDNADQWKANGRFGVATVQQRGNLFPSSLGDVRLASDVVIAQPAANRILSTSGVVSYLFDEQILLSKDRAFVRDKARQTTMTGFLMGTIGERQVLLQGDTVDDMVARYRKLRSLREKQAQEGGTGE